MTTDIDRVLATPIANIPRDPNETEIVRRFWATANGQIGRTPANINLLTGLAEPSNNYSQVLVRIPEGTLPKDYLKNGWTRGPGGNFSGRKVALPMPMRDEHGNMFLPPNGKDSQASVQLPDGTWYNYWRLQVPWNGVTSAIYDNPNIPEMDVFRDILARRWFNPQFDFVTSTVEIVPPDAMGNGYCASPAIPMNQVLTIEEILDGVTKCMQMGVSSKCSMNGPRVKPGEAPILTHEDPRLFLPASMGGRGASRMPASMLETTTAYFPIENQVSDGTRMFCTRTDEEIDAWIGTDTSSFLAQIKRNIAIGAREFGWMIGQTSGATGPTSIYCEGGVEATNTLTAHGLTAQHMSTMLNGLLTPTNIGVVIPPTGVMPNGIETTMHAKAVSISY